MKPNPHTRRALDEFGSADPLSLLLAKRANYIEAYGAGAIEQARYLGHYPAKG